MANFIGESSRARDFKLGWQNWGKRDEPPDKQDRASLENNPIRGDSETVKRHDLSEVSLNRHTLLANGLAYGGNSKNPTVDAPTFGPTVDAPTVAGSQPVSQKAAEQAAQYPVRAAQSRKEFRRRDRGGEGDSWREARRQSRVENEEKGEAKKAANTEKEWAKEVSWDILAKEMSSLPEVGASSEVEDGKTRFVDLDVGKVAIQVGKLRKLAVVLHALEVAPHKEHKSRDREKMTEKVQEKKTEEADPARSNEDDGFKQVKPSRSRSGSKKELIKESQKQSMVNRFSVLDEGNTIGPGAPGEEVRTSGRPRLGEEPNQSLQPEKTRQDLKRKEVVASKETESEHGTGKIHTEDLDLDMKKSGDDNEEGSYGGLNPVNHKDEGSLKAIVQEEDEMSQASSIGDRSKAKTELQRAVEAEEGEVQKWSTSDEEWLRNENEQVKEGCNMIGDPNCSEEAGKNPFSTHFSVLESKDDCIELGQEVSFDGRKSQFLSQTQWGRAPKKRGKGKKKSKENISYQMEYGQVNLDEVEANLGVRLKQAGKRRPLESLDWNGCRLSTTLNDKWSQEDENERLRKKKDESVCQVRQVLASQRKFKMRQENQGESGEREI
ncbi:hypothetical protein R1sor_002561 [Riccia sorocarpa]|uniref:Uncharacterized protein n=1 Tax=Riccia sorocarpa TaxID=122646 RepID=A0ABD3H1V3_9MARC